MLTLLFADKEFFPAMLRLATPIALQNLIVFSLGMVDIIMIGQLGETHVAAVGLAEQPFFLFVLLRYLAAGLLCLLGVIHVARLGFEDASVLIVVVFGAWLI